MSLSEVGPARGGQELGGRQVAVIGAGMTGLVAAYRLAVSGVEVDVYERWPGLGGQVATVDVGAPEPIERYYHHLFTSDRHIAALYEEIGLGDSARVASLQRRDVRRGQSRIHSSAHST